MRALIFDFDGLILDTEQPDYLAWQEVYQSFGVSLPLEKWVTIVGGNAESDFEPHAYLESLIGKPVDREEIWVARRKSYLTTLDSQPIQPGVDEYLAAAKQHNLKLAVASSSPENWVVGHLTRLALLSHFDVVVTADDVTKIKPNPEIFLLTAEKLGVDPREAIVFEDSPNGVKAAKRAQMYAVAVPNPITAQFDLSEADLRLDSLGDMPLEALLAHVERSI